MEGRFLSPSPVLALVASGFAGLFLLGGCAGKASAGPISEPAVGQGAQTDEPPAPQHEVGVYHIIESGQTLFALYRVYQVPVETLIETNGIADPTRIPTGTPIFIPGADHILPVPVPGRPLLAWPLGGRVTSVYGVRGGSGHHEGIDIDGEMGQEIRAAAAGFVARAGTNGSYGRMVLIDHGGGLTTFYAHASRLLVTEGEQVEKGQPVAEVGRSGNARGTHLHFEARRDGHPVDPLPLLGEAVAVNARRGQSAGRN